MNTELARTVALTVRVALTLDGLAEDLRSSSQWLRQEEAHRECARFKNAQNVKRMRIILPAAWKMAAVESTTASEVQVSLLTRFTIFGQFQARFHLRGRDFF